MSSAMVLRLYVCGTTPPSEQAAARIQALCAGAIDADLEIIDVLVHPDAAEIARILATPVLIKEAPAPVRRIVGDLSDTAAILALLAPGPGTSAAHDKGAPT